MKIRTAEEQRRIEEEEDKQFYFPGFTLGEYRRLPKRQQERESQKFKQVATSSLGYWKTCSLAPCRRAKACRGLLSEAQVKSGIYQTYFPPCIKDGAYRQEATLKEIARLYGVPDAEETR